MLFTVFVYACMHEHTSVPVCDARGGVQVHASAHLLAAPVLHDSCHDRSGLCPISSYGVQLCIGLLFAVVASQFCWVNVGQAFSQTL